MLASLLSCGPAPLSTARVAITVAVDNDHDGIDDNFEQKLAEKFAPIIFIEPNESNYPVNVEWFLARAHLQYHEDCTIDTDDDIGPNPIGSQANLIGPPWSHGADCGQDDTGYSHPPHRLLTTIATDPDGQWSVGDRTTGYSDQQTFVIPDVVDADRVGSTNPLDWKTYIHVYPAADGGVMIQYWHIFSYNKLSIAGIGDHGGDWDASIQVQLDRNLELKGVWFSRHDDDHPGDFFGATGNSGLQLDGTHPLMAIDGGGHAAFANPADFCNKRSPAGGTITWPLDPSDRRNPAKLGVFKQPPGNICIPPGRLPWFPIGGTVWETWTGGSVKSAGTLTHPLPTPSGHGGLVNLGEYNPCTPTTCVGSRQASSLLAGQFNPLNGQIFIRYEGRWGSLPHQPVAGTPPRGPVFQGFEEHKDGVSIYTSWYNEGANDPATNDGSHPWLVPPTTTSSLSGPVYTSGAVTYVSGTTKIALSATQTALAGEFGSPTTFYRVYPAGRSAPAFTPYAGPFALAPPEGTYLVDYYSVDAIGNVEPTHTLGFTLDTTAPTVTIVKPAATTYPHSTTLVLDYSATDSGSGIQSVMPTMDATTVAVHGLASGQTIDLLTELGLGDHVFAVDVLDNVGNRSSLSVTFSIIATPESIASAIDHFLASGDITLRRGTSLRKKLEAAATARTRGKCMTAARIYQAFINELAAQTGRHVSVTVAAILTGDARYLIAHCP